jgi:hypothetical protein
LIESRLGLASSGLGNSPGSALRICRCSLLSFGFSESGSAGFSFFEEFAGSVFGIAIFGALVPGALTDAGPSLPGESAGVISQLKRWFRKPADCEDDDVED